MNNSTPPTTDAVPTEPTLIGHYALLDCIGRGGMGLVYRARDTKLDRQVAIKCLRTELFEAHYVERFKREALLLAKLNHPNIVQIYDFIEASEQVALVMELVDGQNLQLHLREHIVTFAQRMRWLTEIAQGLAVAHDAGIIHRDLKAENILINQRKVAKITDLGIAKSQDFNATLTDHVAGSYCSMSPEQAMGESLDFKSDLFSFGILAYQLLCGAHPFGDTNNKLQLMQRIISHPPIAPSKHNPDLPPEINDLLGQLLSKDPDKRPDNTHWVAAQLEKLSHLQLANDFVSDDTQALIPNSSAANQSNLRNTGINSAVRTQDHPTFETRFAPVNVAPKKSRWLPIKNYLAENKISVGAGLFSVLVLAAIVIWQLQPKPPKYVAVIPPKLTAEGMQESQQELVKGAVYDAIQQSLIQLDGYYLIPSSEIASANGDNEVVYKATAADELITIEIMCKIEACTISLARLTKKTLSENRLNIESAKKIDVLTENYLFISETVRQAIGDLYSINLSLGNKFSESSYVQFLAINDDYKKNGATLKLLTELNALAEHSNSISGINTLLTEIALDLYHRDRNSTHLDKLEQKLIKFPQTDLHYYYSLFLIQIALQKYDDADKTRSKINTIDSNNSMSLELAAYSLMARKDYRAAISLLQKLEKIRNTSALQYYLANSYWFSGDNKSAMRHINKALDLSPNDYKAKNLKGLIYLFSGDADSAIREYQEILQKTPSDIDSLNNVAIALMLQKKYSEADDALKKALSILPNNTSFLLNYADNQNLLNNKEIAANAYWKIIEQSNKESETPETLRNTAQAQIQLGLTNEALRTLEKLERLDPQSIDTVFTAALIHALAKNNASALLNLEKSLSMGMGATWFYLPWFDSLCTDTKFIALMMKKGEHNRCTHLSH